MSEFTQDQRAIIQSNTMDAIRTGLTARYFATLKNTPQAFEAIAKDMKFDPAAFDNIIKLGQDIADTATAELPIGYRRQSIFKMITLSVVLLDINDGKPIPNSDVIIGRALPTASHEVALDISDPHTRMITDDLDTLIAGYTAQQKVGLHTMLDLTFPFPTKNQ